MTSAMRKWTWIVKRKYARGYRPWFGTCMKYKQQTPKTQRIQCTEKHKVAKFVEVTSIRGNTVEVTFVFPCGRQCFLVADKVVFDKQVTEYKKQETE